MIFSVGLDCFLTAGRGAAWSCWTFSGTSKFESDLPGWEDSNFDVMQADRLVRRSQHGRDGAAMLERQTSQKIAHYLLDFLRKQSVSGGNGAPMLIGNSKGLAQSEDKVGGIVPMIEEKRALPSSRMVSDEQSQQCDQREAADEQRPVAGVEAKKSPLSRHMREHILQHERAFTLPDVRGQPRNPSGPACPA
jgi:hypothetical protein